MLELVVLVVGRPRVQVLERRRLGVRDQGLVVEHVGRRDVVEPADAVERRDAQHVERVRIGEERDARAAARALEHVVERCRATADGRERVVEHLRQWPPAPVGRPLVRDVVGPVLAEVVRAVERRHALEPAVEVGERHPRDDRLEGRVAGCDRGPLREAVVAVAPHADVAVRPRLPRDPVDRVVAVGDLVDERDRLALRAESPAHVLRDEGVAARDEMRGQERDPAVAAVLVVRQAHEHGRERPGAVGEVHVGGQVHAVAHRHHLLPGTRIQRRGPGRRNGHRHAAEACRHRGGVNARSAPATPAVRKAVHLDRQRASIIDGRAIALRLGSTSRIDTLQRGARRRERRVDADFAERFGADSPQYCGTCRLRDAADVEARTVYWALRARAAETLQSSVQ